MLVRALLIVAIATLSGCAIVPDSLEVADGTELVSYSRAVTTGSEAEGKMARWGGIIAGVENKPEATWIEIVHFPLNHYGKPLRSEETVGRFKVRIEGFVDPITFEKGRLVTFLGSIEGQTAGMVGEQPYMYPTIAGIDYHMWRKEAVYDVSTLYFNYSTGWYSPFYSPFYRPYWGGYHSSRVRVIERSSGIPANNYRRKPTRQSINNTQRLQRKPAVVRPQQRNGNQIHKHER